ncbi:serine hydrolase domain-containing protein, partial [Bradyrhizobium sp.]|uniref:serine hydrolase domain-containing protein n=1 Tax=Bradyrhizobium sp. TaxID=376 RepID=UPI00391A7BCC
MQNKTDIDRGLRQRAEAGEIPGVVAVAADSNGVIYEGAFGKRDLGRDDPMTTDSVFWIASMTKPMTALGVMMLQEEGRLSLDDAVEKHLPEFKG